jgi:hypothetical protein
MYPYFPDTPRILSIQTVTLEVTYGHQPCLNQRYKLSVPGWHMLLQKFKYGHQAHSLAKFNIYFQIVSATLKQASRAEITRAITQLKTVACIRKLQVSSPRTSNAYDTLHMIHQHHQPKCVAQSYMYTKFNGETLNHSYNSFQMGQIDKFHIKRNWHQRVYCCVHCRGDTSYDITGHINRHSCCMWR